MVDGVVSKPDVIEQLGRVTQDPWKRIAGRRERLNSAVTKSAGSCVTPALAIVAPRMPSQSVGTTVRKSRT